MSVEQGQSSPVPLEDHGPGCCRDEQQSAWQAPPAADPRPQERRAAPPQHCLPCAE